MGSFATPANVRSLALLETSCGYFLCILNQLIWDEVGQDQLERERTSLELEQECMEVYRRKVDGANISRSRLHQALAHSEAEFTHLLVSLGERSLPSMVTPKDSHFFKGKDIIHTAMVPLLAMLEEYNMYRQEKDEEKQRQRGKKKVQVQVVVEQENMFGSRPSTSNRRLSNRSINGGFGNTTPSNKRFSMSIQQLGPNSVNSPSRPPIRGSKKSQGRALLTREGHASYLFQDTALVVSAT